LVSIVALIIARSYSTSAPGPATWQAWRVIAVLGNLTRDLLPDRPPRIGGGPFHCARALRRLEVQARIYARCAAADRDELIPQVAELGTPVEYVAGTTTAVFGIAYDGDRRFMRIDAIGDAWTPGDVPDLHDDVRWVHVAPLARSDFPTETLAALARGRKLSFDGQGLVRVPETGELRENADYDRDALRHISLLKLNDEEAEVLGDPADLLVPEVVVTHGSRGSTLYVNGRPEKVPAFPLPAEPTGAGDAFSIAYVAARSIGTTPSAAAGYATAVVGAVLGTQ
jgi:sugar/nucleoside kinase (ribokinase family)